MTPCRGPQRRAFAARLAAGVSVAVVTAACSAGNAARSPGASPTAPGPTQAPITITPADGTRQARPDQGIALTATGGRPLGTIQVTANRSAVEGDLTADGTGWRSRWPLVPGKTYTVTAVATAQQSTTTQSTTTITSRFTTAAAQHTLSASVIAPADGATVGVGMPIGVNFSQPVYNKAAIERLLQIQTSRPVQGAWRWMGDQQVVFRPRTYWRPGTRVRLIAHLNGARPAKGVYATRDLRLRFTIGDAVISTVNTRTFHMTVRRNGKIVRTIPISAGKATERRFTTTNGIHVVSERISPVIFDSATVGIPQGDPAYYKIKGYWAVRISDSGEYVNSAPWSVADQGRRNVSHGCVNAAPGNAEWFYKLSKHGDLVVVTGTDRELEPGNGWGFWRLPWKQWIKGSALKQPITTAPHR